MFTLILCIVILILGYFFYGKFVEKTFGPDERLTPAIAKNDGVDNVPLGKGRAFLVQLLNIAGTGPIFGPLMGACFGPVVLLWIVFGSILGGAVHDYMCGMISERNNGDSIAQLSGKYLGTKVLWIMRIFSIILLILVGTVFITSPASLLASLTPEWMGKEFWVFVIIIYYFIARILPVDKVIAKLYPVFGITLIIMAVGIIGGLAVQGYQFQELTFSVVHPDGLPIFPFMFITVACGAISGFHATQSPIISKCVTSEKQGRAIFYGAMIVEGLIAIVWATAGLSFFDSNVALNESLTTLGQSGTVYLISKGLLGQVGGALAIVGVIACPITSGDTAFRSARLILAEIFGLEQGPIKNRLVIAIPLLALGALLTTIDFNIIWRYFSVSNQLLAMVALWVASAYLLKENDKKWASLITAIPAAFMVAVTFSYLIMGKECLGLSAEVGYPVGIISAIALFVIYLVQLAKKYKQ